MLRIDSHQHFWKYSAENFDWITEEMSVIRKDFLPAELDSVLKANDIDGCVSVQANQSEEENDFLLAQAAQYNFIKGIVGWVDLQSDNIESRLAYYQQFSLLKGFRHVLQGEKKRDLMLTPAFTNGISLLNKYGFTYDILIFPDQLPYSTALVKQFPEQKFVLDHLAKPYIKDGKIKEWETDIRAIALHENVYCKISGMVTEANWMTWENRDFLPYLDVVVNAFGPKRIMFGSDWPVCLVAGSYKEILNIVQEYFSSFSKEEQAAVFGGNAVKFYNLN